MAWIDGVLMDLTKQLHPNGSAFKMPEPVEEDALLLLEDGTSLLLEDGTPFGLEEAVIDGGIYYRLQRALIKSEIQLYEDAQALYDSILPDNPNFSVQDALDWQRRLGIYTDNTDLPTQMQAIQTQMDYPGSDNPRENITVIEQTLRNAGFDVRLYPNIFSDGMGGWVSLSPYDVFGAYSGASILDTFELGTNELGESWAYSIIANYIEESKDAMFIVGNNYCSTFFVAGATLTTLAVVPIARKTEFRQLLLKLKPVQTVGYLYVKYP